MFEVNVSAGGGGAFEVDVSAGGLPEVCRRSAGSVPSSRANDYYQREKRSIIHTLWAKRAQPLFSVKFISVYQAPYKLEGMWADWHFMPPNVYIM